MNQAHRHRPFLAVLRYFLEILLTALVGWALVVLFLLGGGAG